MKLEIYGRIIQVGSEYGNPTVKIWLNEDPEVEDSEEDDGQMPEYLECALSEEDAVGMAKSLYEEVRITIETTAPKPTLVGA